MERESFMFFRSWLDGVKLIKNKAQRCDAYDAIIAYALDGVEADAEQLPPAAAIAYVMAKPVIDSGRKKAEAGQKGGEAKPKQTASKSEANGSKTENSASKSEANGSKTENSASNKKKNKDKDKEEEKEKEKEEKTPSPSDEGDGAKKSPPPPSGAADAYMRRVNPTPSPASMAELLEFEQELGTEVCLRAIDAALDENHRTWSYIKAILTAKRDAGVRSAEDWDRLEAERMTAKARQTAKAEGYDPEKMQAPMDFGDLDWVLKEMEEQNAENT